MALELVPHDGWLDHPHKPPNGAPLCALLASRSLTCAACLQSRARLLHQARAKPQSRACLYGLHEMAVPVRIGEETIGFLLTGRVLREAPSEDGFQEFGRNLSRVSTGVSLEKFRDPYFQSRFMPVKAQKAALALLKDFAGHLGAIANQITIESAHSEPHLLQRIRAYIDEHLEEELSLEELSARIGSSKFYVCKLFKRYLRMTFTEYRARCRLERAKSLLHELNRRVSEVAYEAGFQSLTHFNRIFRRFVGTSPTEYRAKLHLSR
jgi:AraC-like DNA-binding protein